MKLFATTDVFSHIRGEFYVVLLAQQKQAQRQQNTITPKQSNSKTPSSSFATTALPPNYPEQLLPSEPAVTEGENTVPDSTASGLKIAVVGTLAAHPTNEKRRTKTELYY